MGTSSGVVGTVLITCTLLILPLVSADMVILRSFQNTRIEKWLLALVSVSYLVPSLLCVAAFKKLRNQTDSGCGSRKVSDPVSKRNNGKHVRPIVLYSLRHTFLTRLGESGCDAWTLARIAGHSPVAMSTRYIYPSEDAVFTAVERLGGHKIGHSAETVKPEARTTKQLPS